jgi:hypothetical protein
LIYGVVEVCSTYEYKEVESKQVPLWVESPYKGKSLYIDAQNLA